MRLHGIVLNYKHKDNFASPLCVLFKLTLKRVTWNLRKLFSLYDVMWTSKVRFTIENDSGAYPSSYLAGTGVKVGGD
jgi:hypothetical protein